MSAETPAPTEKHVVRLRTFGIVTSEPEKFVDQLEKLCQKFTDSKEDYCYSYDVDFAP